MERQRIFYATPSTLTKSRSRPPSARPTGMDSHFKRAMENPSTTSEATLAKHSFKNSAVKQMSRCEYHLHFHHRLSLPVVYPSMEQSSSSTEDKGTFWSSIRNPRQQRLLATFHSEPELLMCTPQQPSPTARTASGSLQETNPRPIIPSSFSTQPTRLCKSQLSIQLHYRLCTTIQPPCGTAAKAISSADWGTFRKVTEAIIQRMGSLSNPTKSDNIITILQFPNV
jgi:hypothetical protein